MYDYLFGIVAAVVAMLALGIGDGMIASAKCVGAQTILFYRNLVISLLLGFLTFSLASFHPTWDQLGIAVLIGVINYVPVLLIYTALRSGKLGIVKPLSSSYVMFIAIFSAVFFGKFLRMQQIVGVIILVVGVILITVNFSDFTKSEIVKSRKSVILALCAGVGWGIGFSLYIIPISQIGSIPAAFVFETVIFLMAAGYLFSTRSFSVPSRKSILVFTIVGGLAAIASVAMNYSFAKASAGVAGAIVGSNCVVSVLYGRVVEKEKITNTQYFGVAIVVVGVVVLATA